MSAPPQSEVLHLSRQWRSPSARNLLSRSRAPLRDTRTSRSGSPRVWADLPSADGQVDGSSNSPGGAPAPGSQESRFLSARY